MSGATRLSTIACLGVLLLAILPGSASAAAPSAPKPNDLREPNAAAADHDSADKTPAEKSATASVAPDKLALEQRRVADQFKHLEEVLLRMAELTGSSDPRRAALLKKAVAQSKEQLVDVQFDRLVELLQKDQLSRAIDGQAGLDQDLHALLELLLSENRAKQIDAQKKRFQQYVKQIGDIIKEQKGIQGRTAGGEKTEPLSDEQGKLAEKTGNLGKEIKTNEEGKTERASPGKTARSKQDKPGGESKPSTKQPEKSPDSGQPSPKGDAEANGEKKDAAKGQAKGKSQPQQPQEGNDSAKSKPNPQGPADDQSQEPNGADDQQADQPQGQKPGQDAAPARKRVEAARDRMKEAEERLKKAERQGAVDKQEEALRELEQARAALEEILRQLREEEIQRTLAMLEGRFRKMLDVQREVYDGTVRLDKVPAAEHSEGFAIDASRLGSKESQIVVETDKALMLLHEDGTAVVFPEAIEQMRDDAQQVVVRLAQAKVEQITQGIERDIIAALEEMIDALKKAQKQQQQQRKAPRPGQGQLAQAPLVDTLAELKMIRALQLRVNTRTERYSKLVEGEQAEQADLVEALRRLSERETRIHRVTHDLELGRNQ